MAVSNRITVSAPETLATADQPGPIADRSLQRRAMLTMLLAMLVMALGVPLHITAFGLHDAHAASAWSWGAAWLSGLLTLGTLWIARQVLRDSMRALRRSHFRSTELVVICALVAFGVSCLALANDPAAMYFDVTAMSIAWIVTSQAQSAAIRRRFQTTLEQLAPLDRDQPLVSATAAPARIDRGAMWVGGMILLFGMATLGWHLLSSDHLAHSIVSALAVAAAGCPCTLTIAESSAWDAGVERAAAVGWLVSSGRVFSQIATAPELVPRLAVAVIGADPAALVTIARATQRVVRWNRVWAISFHLALLPLALLGSIPTILPAATMLLARLLICCTTRRLQP